MTDTPCGAGPHGLPGMGQSVSVGAFPAQAPAVPTSPTRMLPPPRRPSRLAVALVLACSAGAAQADGLFFYPPFYTPAAMTADGRITVGQGTLARHAVLAAPSGDLTDLGVLNASDTLSFANDVDATGTLVVGTSGQCISPFFCTSHAFRWSAGTGMVALANPFGSGNESSAAGISDDGSTIVGWARTGASAVVPTHAVLWRGASVQDLGTLATGRNSEASGVSSNGGVVVGVSDLRVGQDPNDGADVYRDRAFRWTATGGMQNLGVLAGDHASRASAVSADGSVVVGTSEQVVDPLSAQPGAQQVAHRQAFRWTATGGMQALGYLAGDTQSVANAVSGDGRVVVGASTTATFPRLDQQHAFRWSTVNGMQSVRDWLTLAGIAVPATLALHTATAVNQDGSVIAGMGHETQSPVGERDIAWIARVGTLGSGLITDVPAYRRGLAEAGLGLAATADALPRAALDGIHRRNLLDRGIGGGTGANCAWASADIAFTDDRQRRRQWFEAGACRDVGDWRLGMGLAGSGARMAFENGGRLHASAHHLTLEAATRFGDRIEADAQATYGTFDVHEVRRYANGSREDASLGTPSGRYAAVRVRAFARDLWHVGDARLTPYATVARTRSTLDPFTETLGGFPARFDGLRRDATEASLGLAATVAAGDATTLTSTLEYTHRLDEPDAMLRADTGGLLGIVVAADDIDRNRAQATIDVDHRFGARSALRVSLGANAGDNASLGLGVAWSTRF